MASTPPTPHDPATTSTARSAASRPSASRASSRAGRATGSKASATTGPHATAGRPVRRAAIAAGPSWTARLTSMPRWTHRGWTPKSVMKLTVGMARRRRGPEPAEAEGGQGIGGHDHPGSRLSHPAQHPPPGEQRHQPGDHRTQPRSAVPQPVGGLVGRRNVLQLELVAAPEGRARLEAARCRGSPGPRHGARRDASRSASSGPHRRGPRPCWRR